MFRTNGRPVISISVQTRRSITPAVHAIHMVMRGRYPITSVSTTQWAGPIAWFPWSSVPTLGNQAMVARARSDRARCQWWCPAAMRARRCDCPRTISHCARIYNCADPRNKSRRGAWADYESIISPISSQHSEASFHRALAREKQPQASISSHPRPPLRHTVPRMGLARRAAFSARR